jgi:hypothetical protein
MWKHRFFSRNVYDNTCLHFTVERIMVFCFVHGPVLSQNTTFRKLDLFLSSGKIKMILTLLGPLERAVLNHCTTSFRRWTKSKHKTPSSAVLHRQNPLELICILHVTRMKFVTMRICYSLHSLLRNFRLCGIMFIAVLETYPPKIARTFKRNIFIQKSNKTACTNY